MALHQVHHADLNFRGESDLDFYYTAWPNTMCRLYSFRLLQSETSSPSQSQAFLFCWNVTQRIEFRRENLFPSRDDGCQPFSLEANRAPTAMRSGA
jgi:hypothetical protein